MRIYGSVLVAVLILVAHLYSFGQHQQFVQDDSIFDRSFSQRFAAIAIENLNVTIRGGSRSRQ